jgi:predicted metal-dependent hydrolase
LDREAANQGAVVEGVRRVSAGVQEERLVLKVRRNATKAKRKAALDAWYRSEVEKAAPPLLAKWEAVIGVKAGKLRVRRMKSRWGSCNIATRAICLNSELAKRDPRGLEYVVVHELVHLLERRHNARFKRFMDRFLPGWKPIKKSLNQMSVD